MAFFSWSAILGTSFVCLEVIAVGLAATVVERQAFGWFRIKVKASNCPVAIANLFAVETPFVTSLRKKGDMITFWRSTSALWDKTRSFWDIESYTFAQAREWAKWGSERTSEHSGGRERSEQSGASERVSGASERANGRASGPVL